MSPSPTVRKTDKEEVEVEHVSHTEKQNVGALTSEVNENNNETLWHSIKQNPWVLVYTFLANSGSLLFGYDVLVQGAITALPMFS
jgi:hypothetical protein